MSFERSILTVAVLATLAFVGAGLAAVFGPGAGAEALQRHVLLTLGAVLLLVFPHLWVGIYLFATGRAIGREIAEGRATPEARVEAGGHLRRVLAPIVLTSLAAFSIVAIGQGILAGTTRPWHHVAAFVITLLLQGWALFVERRALGGNAELLARLDAAARR